MPKVLHIRMINQKVIEMKICFIVDRDFPEDYIVVKSGDRWSAHVENPSV